jgi:hypothetical protein
MLVQQMFRCLLCSNLYRCFCCCCCFYIIAELQVALTTT